MGGEQLLHAHTSIKPAEGIKTSSDSRTPAETNRSGSIYVRKHPGKAGWDVREPKEGTSAEERQVATVSAQTGPEDRRTLRTPGGPSGPRGSSDSDNFPKSPNSEAVRPQRGQKELILVQGR